MEKVFDAVYSENRSNVLNVANGIKLYTLDCRGNFDLICYYNQVYEILQNKLMEYSRLCTPNNCRKGSHLRLAFSAWLLSHSVKEDVNKTMPLSRKILQNLYALVSRYDQINLKRFANFVPKKTFYDILYLEYYTSTIDPFKNGLREIMSDTLQSVNDFLVGLSRAENANSKVVVSRYDLREKLRQAKLDTLFKNVEMTSALQEVAYQLKKFIYEDSELHFKNLEGYFAALAKFDKDKNKADVTFMDGQLKTFKKRAETLAKELGEKVPPILDGAAAAVGAELIQATIQLASLFGNILAAFFGQTSASDYQEAAAAVAQATAKLKRAKRLRTFFGDTMKLTDDIVAKLNDNSKFIKNVHELVESLSEYYSENVTSNRLNEKSFGNTIKSFLSEYKNYNPKVQSQDIVGLVGSWGSVLEEGCKLLFSGATTATATIQNVFVDRGDCLDTKLTVAAFATVLREIYEYQFEMMESLAKVCRAELASQRAKGLQSNFRYAKNLKPKKNTVEIAAFEQMILGLQITSVLYKLGIIVQYCDYREYLNAGKMPEDCKEAVRDLSPQAINSLISLREPICPNRRSMFVDIPVTNPFEYDNFGYIPLDRLFKGEPITFEIPNYDWLVRNEWIQKRDVKDTAFYLEHMKIILPYLTSEVLDVQVRVSWSEKSHLYKGYSGLGSSYVIQPNSIEFEYQEELNCRPDMEMVNPYDRCFNKNSKICISLKDKPKIVSPSLFSTFTIQAKISPMIRVPPKFTTKFYLKAQITLCQVRKDGKVVKRKRKRDIVNQCCVDKDECDANKTSKYWNAFLKKPSCQDCPQNSVGDITGHYCVVKKQY